MGLSLYLVKEDSAVSLEGLPLQAGPEDDERSHRPIHVEAQVLCTASPSDDPQQHQI